MKPEDLIYYTRLALGVFMGVLCGLLRLSGFLGLYVGIAGYVLSYYVIRVLFKLDPLKLEKPTSIYTSGGLGYFMLWLVSWTVMYTLYAAP